MKKALALLLALALVLSLAACGGGNAPASSTSAKSSSQAEATPISKDALESALDLSLQQSGNTNNEFTYSSESVTNTSDYLVKTNDKGDIQYIKMSFQNIDTSLLSSADAISDVIDVVVNGDPRLIDVRAVQCISQVMNMIPLFDESYSKKTPTDLIVAIADVFSNGSSQYGNWDLSSTLNQTEQTVEVIAEPAK